MVPGGLPLVIKQPALQGLDRTPPAPEETKHWKNGAGVTVLSAEREMPVLQVPPLTGMKITGDFRLDDGDSAPHWGTHPMVTLENKQVYGSISYLDWLQAPVEKGNDRRFYVATIRGLHPGQFLNIHGFGGYGGGVTRACVKVAGLRRREENVLYRGRHLDQPQAGAIIHNKSNTALLHMTQTSHNDNQSYDVKVIRNQYAHGDTYIYYCDFNYISNVHSAAGDENGNCYGAFIRSLDNNFRGKVESVDWEQCKLKFAAACQNAQTLGDSRPSDQPQSAEGDHAGQGLDRARGAGELHRCCDRTEVYLPGQDLCQRDREESDHRRRGPEDRRPDPRRQGLPLDQGHCGPLFRRGQPRGKDPQGQLPLVHDRVADGERGRHQGHRDRAVLVGRQERRQPAVISPGELLVGRAPAAAGLRHRPRHVRQRRIACHSRRRSRRPADPRRGPLLRPGLEVRLRAWRPGRAGHRLRSVQARSLPMLDLGGRAQRVYLPPFSTWPTAGRPRAMRY